MQIIFIFIGIISFPLLIYSIKLVINQLKLKEIIVFDLTEKTKDFQITKNGIHSICMLGISSDFKISGLEASIITPNGKQINLTENLIRYSSLRKRVKIVEQWKFETNQKGKYTLSITNLDDYISRNPILTSGKLFSNRKIETKSLKILVKQSVSTKHRLISIIGLVLGINGSFWGIMLGINPNLLG